MPQRPAADPTDVAAVIAELQRQGRRYEWFAKQTGISGPLLTLIIQKKRTAAYWWPARAAKVLERTMKSLRGRYAMEQAGRTAEAEEAEPISA